jgi:hypothetical protein
MSENADIARSRHFFVPRLAQARGSFYHGCTNSLEARAAIARRTQQQTRKNNQAEAIV